LDPIYKLTAIKEGHLEGDDPEEHLVSGLQV
jgi:hypothetical protein